VYGDLPLFAEGKASLGVPVYTIYGGFEDMRVVHKFKTGQINIPNLHLLDESHSVVIGGIRYPS
jgi:hypothetical protein